MEGDESRHVAEQAGSDASPSPAPRDAASKLDADALVVDVTLDSDALKLVVDTGATNTFVRASRIVKPGRDCTKSAGSAATLNGSIDTHLCEPGTLRVLGKRAKNFAVRAAEMPGIPAEVDGVLGMDFLTRFVVELDIKNKSIVLHDKLSFTRPTTKPAPIRRSREGYRFIALSLGTGDKLESHYFMIDTGSYLQIGLPEQLLPSPERLTRGHGPSFDGAQGPEGLQDYAQIPVVDLGVEVLTNVDCVLLPNDYKTGVVGRGVLKHVRMTFDFESDLVWLVNSNER